MVNKDKMTAGMCLFANVMVKKTHFLNNVHTYSQILGS